MGKVKIRRCMAELRFFDVQRSFSWDTWLLFLVKTLWVKERLFKKKMIHEQLKFYYVLSIFFTLCILNCPLKSSLGWGRNKFEWLLNTIAWKRVTEKEPVKFSCSLLCHQSCQHLGAGKMQTQFCAHSDWVRTNKEVYEML